MADSKRTKRVRDASGERSLEDHIAERRKQLVELRLEAPALRRRATGLRARADAMPHRYQTRVAADMRRKAALVEAEADARESMSREHEFERTVVCYMKMYHQRPVAVGASRKNDTIRAYVHYSDVAKSRHASIVDEYLTEMHKAPPKVAMAVRDECPRCNVKLLVYSTKSIMSCPECGYSVTYLDATSSSTSFDEVIEYSQYSYKRVNHYVMWLSLVQGKEAHRVPDDILQYVMEDLYDRQLVRHVEGITFKRVRDALRKLKLRKAYDHVAQITMRLSGVRPPRVSTEMEETLKNMFLRMQPAFHRHAPKTRTNFLSYSYVLFRCFQILGLTHMQNSVQLLKGRDKLEANDVIFRKMCTDLGWPVSDLPPA